MTAQRARAACDRAGPAARRGWVAAATLFLLVSPFSALTTLAAQGDNGAVASEHILASRAGIAILERGGNAVDAAVATAFAVCVVNPSSCGIGGGGFLVAYLANEKRAVALDYRETAPAAATRDMYLRDGTPVAQLSLRGGLAVGVPGEVRGMAEALEKYGTLSLAQALAPAIRLAKGGFPVGPHLAAAIGEHHAAIAATPALARNLLRQDGSPKREGDKLAFPELAQTLERIATDGAAAFYEGEIAAQIVASVRAGGGIMTLEDLAGYRPVWREPLAIDFLGSTVFTMPPPSSAGVALQVLGTIAADPLAAHGRESVDYAHLLVEAMKHGFADRARTYGDPQSGTPPTATLLAPTNLQALRRRIRDDAVLPAAQYGTQPEAPTATPPADAGTSHLSVIDRHGNAVACTTTINTPFGAMLVAGETGVLLNNEMDDFSAQPGVPNVYGLIGAEANAIAPGKRPLSSMAPTVVIRAGEARLAAGGSGGPRILSATLQVVLNAIAFELSATDAVGAPRLHHQWMPDVLFHEPGWLPKTRRGLRRRGHTLKEVATLGAVQLVRRTEHGFEAAADPRKHGEAAAW